ncbi:NAD(P)/FAD-dependent oxidoreductase [Planctomicrobium sp. SH661]|uniref:NAD(P)/FAD-dependent oxidoreductase n=1 Tax=Planctomicrobium sp. SH661 TaxID=3448124 RepID=UPI003F5B7C68
MIEPVQPPPLPVPIDHSRRPIVVVGGGVIGASCAHSLAEAGAPVLLLDKGEFGQGCSHGNCGYVSPSHILPLCKPGAIGASLRTLLRRNSPFQLRFQWSWQFWSWMWRFARHCNQIDMIHAGHARHALLTASRELYSSMIASGVLRDCEWETKGLLFVHQSQEHFDKFADTDALLRKEFGLGAKAIAEPDLLKLEPTLKPGIAGAWFYECDAHLRPDKLMDAWQARLVSDGVSLRERCELIDIEQGDSGVSAVITTAGRIEVDQVVFATGAWTRLMKKQLRIPLPIEPGKGYSITMRRPNRCPKYPMIFEDHRVAVTPFASGFRVGSTMEFAGFDPSLKPARLKLLTDAARRYLHEPLTEPFLEKWSGWRPMSADGVPLIGRIPHLKNAWIAAGHSMLGVSMAPSTGRLIAELITGRHPHVDPHPYRVDRF